MPHFIEHHDAALRLRLGFFQLVRLTTHPFEHCNHRHAEQRADLLQRHPAHGIEHHCQAFQRTMHPAPRGMGKLTSAPFAPVPLLSAHVPRFHIIPTIAFLAANLSHGIPHDCQRFYPISVLLLSVSNAEALDFSLFTDFCSTFGGEFVILLSTVFSLP